MCWPNGASNVELENRFTLPAPAEFVWSAFRDVELVVTCLPGASLLAPPAEMLDLQFQVKLGPIAATFKGNGAVTYDDALRTGQFTGSGADRTTGSRVKGNVDFRLETPQPDVTDVRVLVDYQLTGTLAQFSRGGIVRELASALTRQFADNLRQALAARAADASALPADSGPLSATALLWSAVKHRVRSGKGDAESDE